MVKNRLVEKGGEFNFQELVVCIGDWRFFEFFCLVYSMYYGLWILFYCIGEQIYLGNFVCVFYKRMIISNCCRVKYVVFENLMKVNNLYILNLQLLFLVGVRNCKIFIFLIEVFVIVCILFMNCMSFLFVIIFFF